jgi:predicted SAM-dependent methyltransferase
MIRLQFACGGNILEGWQNFEKDTVDLDQLPLNFADNYADMIFLEHAGEHWPCDHLLKMIEDFRRILKPGGTLRLCFPVVGVHLKRAHARELLVNHGHKSAMDQNIAITMLWAAGFELPNIKITGREVWDSHWKAIGRELDDIETLRIQATKSI